MLSTDSANSTLLETSIWFTLKSKMTLKSIKLIGMHNLFKVPILLLEIQMRILLTGHELFPEPLKKDWLKCRISNLSINLCSPN